MASHFLLHSFCKLRLSSYSEPVSLILRCHLNYTKIQFTFNYFFYFFWTLNIEYQTLKKIFFDDRVFFPKIRINKYGTILRHALT